jgi:lysophospholipase L1-like esterase
MAIQRPFGSVGGGSSTATYGRRVLLLGDSIAYFHTFVSTSAYPNNRLCYNDEGFLNWTRRLLGQRIYFDPALNKGVSGNRTDQVLARFQTDVAANASNFDILVVLAGTNDILQGTSVSSAFASIKSIVANGQALGKAVVLLTVPPMTAAASSSGMTANSYKQLQYLNTLIREWARTQSGVVLVDAFRSLADPTSANGYAIASLMHGDGIHPAAGGSYRIGLALANALAPLLPASPSVIASAADAYDATYNPLGNRVTNGCFSAASGGTVSNGQGTVASGWTLFKPNGGWVNSEVTASVEVQAAGVNAVPGNKQVLAVNIASGKTNLEQVVLTQGIFGIAPGKQVVLEAELDVSGVSNLWYSQIGIGDSDNSNFPICAADGFNQWATSDANLNKWDPAGTYNGLVFRTPVYTVVSGATLYAQLTLGFDASAAAATATVKLAGMTLRVLN